MFIDPTAPQDKPETQQMLVIHKVMRREFDVLPKLVAAVPPGDVRQAKRVAGHANLLLMFLHHHHDSEDRMLWPAMLARAPMDAATVEKAEKQHEVVAGLIETVQATVNRWQTGASESVRDHLVGELRQLYDALIEHLDDEEADILPLVHEHVTVAEWDATTRDAAEGMPKNPKIGLLMAGMVLEDATPAERVWFLGELPPPVRLVWRAVGERMYNRYVHSVRQDR
ncbi:hemerythrin domain-containing protein [Kibdelosporangium philippinense]|uniref:Hemerythrin domain-containing protein n=1 Tax=Kibdelosporangium philippinense TaxID=211113 RepID=A0ABS8ZA04_9PSEU|nr:hemerythrin domain-containing protein [Kibdelosporangium philippinense]MCE7003868.1 hemerythrin domain-containing protein [Kibdelosporangium philippinense]